MNNSETNYFLHRGASNPQTTPVGATGCIEITDGMYNSMNQLIENLAGSTNRTAIGESGNLTIIYEASTRPNLVVQ